MQTLPAGQDPLLQRPPQPSSAPQALAAQFGARGLLHEPSHWYVPPQVPHGIPWLGGFGLLQLPSHWTVPPHEPQEAPWLSAGHWQRASG
jgi:hypothetical protein